MDEHVETGWKRRRGGESKTAGDGKERELGSSNSYESIYIYVCTCVSA